MWTEPLSKPASCAASLGLLATPHLRSTVHGKRQLLDPSGRVAAPGGVAPAMDELVELAARGSERIGDRDVDVGVPLVVVRIVRDRDRVIRDRERDPHLEQVTMTMAATRFVDDDGAVLDPLVDMLEPSEPALDRRFDRWACRHPAKRDVE